MQWGGGRREVYVSEDCRLRAQQHFPSGGSIDGKPSWELFEAGPLAALKLGFGLDWGAVTIAGPGVRVQIIHGLPIFPAMAAYAVLVKEGSREWVEIVDIEVDADYFKLIDDDPED